MKTLQYLQNLSRRSLQYSTIRSSFLIPRYVNKLSFSTKEEVTYTLDQLKELRSISGAPLKECKKALIETEDTENRISDALDWLRIRGQSIAQQKSGDIAKYGFIGLFKDNTQKNASLIEVNCVTDFVENNPLFQGAVLNIGNTILETNTQQILYNTPLSIDEISNISIIEFENNNASNQSINESLTDIISSIRENLVFRRAYKMQCTSKGIICGYLHGRKTNNLGMKGSLVSLETDLNEINDEIYKELNELGQNIATHIVANYPQPKYINRNEITEQEIEKEKEILLQTIMQKEGEGKNLEIVQKQIDGKMKKYYMENVLLEQPFCLEDDNKLTVEKLINNKAKQLECNISVAHMIVYNLGEA
eukprot:233616_1